MNSSNVKILNSKAIKNLFSKLRCKNADSSTFIKYSTRLMKILAEEAIAELPGHEAIIETPCGQYHGLNIPENNCIAVSIVRAGDSLLDAVRSCIPDIPVGKILIQRDESSEEKKPILFYKKLPKNLVKENKAVLLVDPMLATGGSAVCAIQVLLDEGVLEENIIFVNVVSCPEGLKLLNEKHPRVKIVTAAMDEKLNEDRYIVPGVGDWGDRFFGTED